VFFELVLEFLVYSCEQRRAFQLISVTLVGQIFSLLPYLIRASFWLLVVLVAGIVWLLVAAGCGLVRICEYGFGSQEAYF
jgi:uncharacterized membrane protein